MFVDLFVSSFGVVVNEMKIFGFKDHLLEIQTNIIIIIIRVRGNEKISVFFCNSDMEKKNYCFFLLSLLFELFQ